jgi:hypothetical protein
MGRVMAMARSRAATGLWALVLGGVAGLALAAGPPLPQRNLSVEARVVEASEVEREALAAGGSVTVGTAGATTVQGGVTLRAGNEQAETRQVQRVLVLNGGRATLRLSQLVPLRSLALAWTGRTAGVSERIRWVDVGSGMTVQPRWPGGAAEVQVDVEIDSAPAGDATAERTRVQTQLSLPLGQWVTVAVLGERSDSRSGGSGLTTATAARASSRSLQLRVSAP